MQSLYQLLIAAFTVGLIAIFEPSCVRPLIIKYILGNFLGERKGKLKRKIEQTFQQSKRISV
jgi:hypothetical protein